MNSYEALSGQYDLLMRDGQYRRRADYLLRQFQKSSIPVETVLDLGCGTGTIACLLSQAGLRVLAADASEEMLTEAAAKAMSLPQPPFFLHQFMSQLRLPHPVDAVISTLDSLNYVTRSRDVQETFRRVYRYLRPGGSFLFDINTPEKLQRMDGQVWMDEQENVFCVWRTDFSAKTAICTYSVDLFQRLEDNSWSRSYEEHREKAWQPEQLQQWLEECGFSVRITGDLTIRPPREGADRILFHCKKPLEI